GANQLAAIKADHGPVAVGDLVVAGEKGASRDDAKAHPLHPPQRLLVAIVRQEHSRTERGEVAAGGPLLPLLLHSTLPAAEHRFDRHSAFLERRENAAALVDRRFAAPPMEN